mgnify:CR=1 FL=1
MKKKRSRIFFLIIIHLIIFQSVAVIVITDFGVEGNYSHFNDRRNISKKSPENLLENFTGFELFPGQPTDIVSISDIDDNSLVDLIGLGGDRRVKIEWSPENQTFTRVEFGELPGIGISASRYFEDLNGDNTIDLHNGKSLFNWINNSLVLVQEGREGYEFGSQDFGDYDSDGDFDFLCGAGRSGFYIGKNLGNGTFVNAPKNGLPSYQGAGTPSIRSLCHEFQDINGDGWIDIGCGIGSDLNEEPGPYLFWTNNGKERWAGFSEGCPTYDFGWDMDMSDMDNDGDFDCVMYFNNNKTKILENNFPQPWRIHDLPDDSILASGFTPLNLEAGDLDNDGLNDVVQTYYQVVKDDEGEIQYSNAIIAIYYNNGDYTFRIEKTESFIQTYPRLLPLSDIDLDGMLDIITSPGGKNDPGINPIVFFNKRSNQDDFLIKPLRRGDIYRAGTYEKIEWSSSRMNELLGPDNRFNLSISFFGKSGKYDPLITNLTKWWTYWTVPDFPTNNAYIKVEGMNLSDTYGPIKIHSKDDQLYPVDVSFDVDHDYVTTNRNVNVILKPDIALEQNVTVHVNLDHSNGTVDMGFHNVTMGSETVFSWFVPYDMFELDCRFETSFQYKGNEALFYQENGYNILSDDRFFENVRLPSNNDFYKGLNGTFHIGCLARDGSNLTHSSIFEVMDNSEYFTIENLGDGSFSIQGEKLGSDMVFFKVNCFGVIKSVGIQFDIVRSISALGLEVEQEIHHTGDMIRIGCNPLDNDGDPVELEKNEVEWTVSGPATGRYPGVELFATTATAPGAVGITGTSNLGHGDVRENITVIVEPAINKILLTVTEPLVVNQETILVPEIISWNDSKLDYSALTWDIPENVIFTEIGNGSVIIKPTNSKEFEISCTAGFLNETYTESFKFSTNVSLADMELIPDYGSVPIGGMTEVTVLLQGSNGNTYDLWHRISVSISGQGDADFDVENDIIKLMGKSEGSIELNVFVETLHGSYSDKTALNVFRAPSLVIYKGPERIIRSLSYPVSFTVLDRKGIEIFPENYTATVENYSFDPSSERWIIGYDTTGELRIRINVQVEHISIQSFENIEVLPRSEGIETGELPHPIRENTNITIKPNMKLEGGKVTSNVNWSIIGVSGEIDYRINEDGSIEIQGFPPGLINLTLSGERNGEITSKEITLEVLESPEIDSILIKKVKGDGGTLIHFQVLDQYGFDISDLCDFKWSGDYNWVDGNSSFVEKGKVTVHIELDDSSVRKEIEIEEGNKEKSSILIIIIPVIIIIILLLVVFFLIRKRLLGTRDTYYREEIES